MLTPRSTPAGAGRRLLALCLACALSLWPRPSPAHPHGWVDVTVRVQMDERGRVEALQQRWRLDPFYSQLLLEELRAAQGEASMEARLDQLGVEIRHNLSPQHYFTHVTRDGEAVALGEVDEFTTLERDGRVVLMFRLPLAEPLPLDQAAMRYRIYDPTYYIEVLHEADDEAPRPDALRVTGADCATRIMAADPDPAKVAEAATLDRTEQAPEGLGRFFAETGEVRCDLP
ncbi:DUF1007 family protein [Halomonas stenophila]|uniref:ABC-type uncharacterized transport system substrate-binding protein n=1 Tax=Halomonas stenophila TaxID=795312 RepID=A0A7W5ETX1_9GAMM|nr:DUF1007 family protein [Halomonas stenophila]MBB3230977.1 ABC-type uncharacterized transport system substrate-binding protein [Halomonas stenophila]